MLKMFYLDYSIPFCFFKIQRIIIVFMLNFVLIIIWCDSGLLLDDL